MSKVHFGVTIPQIKRTWEETKSASQEFEAMGFDSLWVCDHLYGPQSAQAAGCIWRGVLPPKLAKFP